MNYRFFPFMSSISSLFFGKTNSNPSDSSSLDSTIAAWKMKRVELSGDGNCCFVAIAHGLQLIKRKQIFALPNIHNSILIFSVSNLDRLLYTSGRKIMSITP